MPEIYITVTGFNNYQGKVPLYVGARLLCRKDPMNPYDTEAISVIAPGGMTAGYVANSNTSKANGTASAGRIYDGVGEFFLIEVRFSTNTKVICRIIDFDVKDRSVLARYSRSSG